MSAFSETAPIIVVDDGGELDRPYWIREEYLPTDKHGKPIPVFTRKEVAKCFFGWRSIWLKRRMAMASGPDGLLLDGEVYHLRRSRKGDPAFTLADIERVAHALAQAGLMTGQHLQRTVAIVRACAIQYEVPL